MQVHGPSRVLKDDGSEVSSRLNGDFVAMEIGDVSLYVWTPEEFDWIIKAAAEGKQMLLDSRPAEWCPAFTGPDDRLDVTVCCDRKAGHPGSHHGDVGGGAEVAWSDCRSGMPHGGGVTCTLAAGHEGLCRAGRTVWSGGPAQDETPASVTA